jgi:hypothetical protein
MDQHEADVTVAKEAFPFLVQRLSYQSLELDIGIWVCENVGDAMIIISKVRHGPVQNFGPVLITYGFKFEADAVAFKLKFAGI